MFFSVHSLLYLVIRTLWTLFVMLRETVSHAYL